MYPLTPGKRFSLFFVKTGPNIILVTNFETKKKYYKKVVNILFFFFHIKESTFLNSNIFVSYFGSDKKTQTDNPGYSS